MDQQLFDDLAVVSIYHFADVLYKQRAIDAAERLIASGVLTSVDDGETAYEKYEDIVLKYALEQLPSGYAVRHDYWGAKCITNEKGWNAPKSGLFSGDNPGRIMLFDSFAALDEYTNDALARI